jgi:hypothetical protein
MALRLAFDAAGLDALLVDPAPVARAVGVGAGLVVVAFLVVRPGAVGGFAPGGGLGSKLLAAFGGCPLAFPGPGALAGGRGAAFAFPFGGLLGAFLRGLAPAEVGPCGAGVREQVPGTLAA